MAIKIDDELLGELGLSELPKPDRQKLLEQIYQTLETRVGGRIMHELTDVQLKQFEQLIDSKDEKASLDWLRQNYPKYGEVVAQELAKLKLEIKASAPTIISASQIPPKPLSD